MHDLDVALDFYRGGLGLTVRTDIQMGPQRWLTVGSDGSPTEISLETPDGRPGDLDALRSVVAAGSLTAAIFSVDAVDDLFDQLVAAGAPVVQEPLDQPYGVRDCAVRDPSGNMVRLAQATGTS